MLLDLEISDEDDEVKREIYFTLLSEVCVRNNERIITVCFFLIWVSL